MNHSNKIFVIAGHDLRAGGAASGDRKEGELTIELRDLIVDALLNQRPGLTVVVDDDRDSLGTVISKINKQATADDILFDVHFNAAAGNAKGAETFVSVNAREKSKVIAKRITELTAAMLGTPNRGVKLESQSQHNRLGILHTPASSVLWEVEFISNEDRMTVYDEMKHRIAIGIANILIQELESE